MRIGLFAPNEYPYPVPAGAIHGVLTVAGALADGLVKRGHDVQFFCSEDSTTTAHKRSFGMSSFTSLASSRNIPKGFIRYQAKSIYAQRMASKMIAWLNDHPVDVLHLHNMREVLPLIKFLPNIPKVITVHDNLFIERYRNCAELYKDEPETYFVSISKRQQRGLPSLPFFANVYNGTDTNLFKFNPNPKKQLLFSGRFIPEKGVDIALKASRMANLPIHAVGFFDPRVDLPKDFMQTVRYWLRQPHVQYSKKSAYVKLARYYGEAAALLFPVQWEEAFGLVLIEAMSCGTPVIAFKRGSVPEIVKNGKTGFIVRTLPEMVRAIKKIPEINRQTCRDYAVKHFSLDRMVDNYVATYQAVIKDYKTKWR